MSALAARELRNKQSFEKSVQENKRRTRNKPEAQILDTTNSTKRLVLRLFLAQITGEKRDS